MLFGLVVVLVMVVVFVVFDPSYKKRLSGGATASRPRAASESIPPPAVPERPYWKVAVAWATLAGYGAFLAAVIVGGVRPKWVGAVNAQTWDLAPFAVSVEGLILKRRGACVLQKWEGFIGVLETTHTFALLAPGSVIAIPKRSFSPEELIAYRQLFVGCRWKAAGA
jgi:hypothetical protein